MLANKQEKSKLTTMLTAVAVFLLAMAPGIVEAACVEPPSGLVSWWSGDGHAYDIAGENNGTLSNGATFAPGLVGEAFSFDGVDDQVWASGTGIADLQQLTIEAWVNMRSPGGRIERFVALVRPKAVLRYNYNQLHCYILFDAGDDPDVWRHVRGGSPLSADTWYHVAVTYDGADIRLYLDGSEVDSNAYAGTVVTGGGVRLSTAGETLDGLLDEVGVYNRALDASEIQAIYNAGSEGKCKRDIDVSPLTLDFGNVDEDTSSTAVVTVSNVGSADLTVSGIALQAGSSSGFSITSVLPVPPVTMISLDEIAVEITYTSSAVGLASGILEITSDDPVEPVVEVVLDGFCIVTAVEPTPVGDNVQVKLTDKRTGTKTLTVEFEHVIVGGDTKAVIRKATADDGLPPGFKRSDQGEIYEITTTATVSKDSKVTVGIDYSKSSFKGSPARLKVFSYTGTLFTATSALGDGWADVTTFNDTMKKTIYAAVAVESLSLFAVLEPEEVDPFGLINGLINDVVSLNLQKGISNSLDAKLDAAQKAVDDMNANNDVAAINTLEAFINAVEAQSGAKIPVEDAERFISQANEIITKLSAL